jgi:hypothetical protein
MNDGEICNVLIIHAGDIDPRVLNLEGIVRQARGSMRYMSLHVRTQDADLEADCIKYIGEIDWATTLLIVITPAAREAMCLTSLVEYAKNSNKRVVGIWGSGTEARMPDALDSFADAVLPMASGDLVLAICGELDCWVHPDGTPFGPRDIPRHKC